jgi:hypothetical protein
MQNVSSGAGIHALPSTSEYFQNIFLLERTAMPKKDGLPRRRLLAMTNFVLHHCERSAAIHLSSVPLQFMEADATDRRF